MGRFLGFGIGTLWLTTLAACLFRSEEDPGSSPPATAPTQVEDPGCTAIEITRTDAGATSSVVHLPARDGDAGTDSGGTDSGGTDSGVADDAGPLVDAGEVEEPTDGGGSLAPPGVTLQGVQTVGCRTGTQFDLAAAADGALHVAASGIRGALITFTPDAQKPTPRLLTHLRREHVRVAVTTLEDGRAATVGFSDERTVVVQEGETVPQPFPLSDSAYVHGKTISSTGAVLVSLGTMGLLRPANGTFSPVQLPPRNSADPYAQSSLGLGNDGQMFRVTASASPSLDFADRSIDLGPRGVRGASFTTLDPSSRLPALALVRGSAQEKDTAGEVFEIGVPRGDGYLYVPVNISAAACAADSSCANQCEERAQVVDPAEIGMTWDGARAYVAFVRRTVTRTRRYRMDQNTGWDCQLFDCDPYCTHDLSTTTDGGELVVASIDTQAPAVHELYVVPLAASGGNLQSGGLTADDSTLQIGARDGWLHVARTGLYQHQFAGFTSYRFRVAP